MSRKLTRRTFLEQLGGATAAALGAGVVGAPSLAGSTVVHTAAAEMGPNDSSDRRWQAYQVRHDAAMAHSNQPFPSFPTNGDEEAYPTKIASYTKGLPHNERGEVDLAAYGAFLKALETGQYAAFEAVPLGGQVKFANPLAAYAFELEGLDPHQYAMPAPPAFSSAETAGEMIELYWQALTRDIPFAEYETHALTNAAVADLAKCADFRGPKLDGAVTLASLFRGATPGDLVGPYVSQFLWLDVEHGSMTLTQRNRVAVAKDDYMRTYPEWLNIQRGLLPARVNVLDPTPRHLRNGRDLAGYVYRDYSYQAYLNACLILLAIRAPLKTEQPYKRSLTQSGFITFGPPHVLDCLARVANAALKASWCHKWLVHRKLRPEAFGGRVHTQMMKMARYPLHADLFQSTVLDAVFRSTGSYLLPLAYPEGCPTHPSYPAGHAAIAGACVTVLKAFFNEGFVLPQPVVASADGLSLLPYKETALMVGGELNKLAANIALARNTAGVHWRSDSIEGIKLGESVAVGILRDLRATYSESFGGFKFTAFDGATLVV